MFLGRSRGSKKTSNAVAYVYVYATTNVYVVIPGYRNCQFEKRSSSLFVVHFLSFRRLYLNASMRSANPFSPMLYTDIFPLISTPVIISKLDRNVSLRALEREHVRDRLIAHKNTESEHGERRQNTYNRLATKDCG